MRDRPESTDAMFDTSPRAMATRFADLMICRIRDGRDPYEAARLAGSYAWEVIRDEDRAKVTPFNKDGRE